jgi:hypothetical protein
MPRGDKSGPLGEGPMTGRGAGFCTGNNQPGFSGGDSAGGRRPRFFGLGRGGRGPGRGRGGFPGRVSNAAYVPPVQTREELLKQQQRLLESELAQVRKALDGIEKEGTSDS